MNIPCRMIRSLPMRAHKHVEDGQLDGAIGGLFGQRSGLWAKRHSVTTSAVCTSGAAGSRRRREPSRRQSWPSAAEPDWSRADAPFRSGVLFEAPGRRTSTFAALRQAASTRPPNALWRLTKARLQFDASGHDAAEHALLAVHSGDQSHQYAGHRAGRGRRRRCGVDLLRARDQASPHHAGSVCDPVRCRTIRATDPA